MLEEKNINFLNQFCGNIKPFLINEKIDILPCLSIALFNYDKNILEYIQNIMLNKKLSFIDIDIQNYWSWKKSNQILKNQYCIFDLTKLNNYIKKYNLDYEINILHDLYKNIGGIIYISNEININTYIFTISNYIFWNIKDLDHSNLIDQFNFILQKSVSSKTNENIKYIKTNYNTIIINKLQLWPKYEYLN
jgi:hypothetical protein